MTTWTFEHEGTHGWNGLWRIGRFEFGFHLYRHRYPSSPDRWVFQPFFVVDRRRR